MKFIKWLGYLILIAILGFGGYVGYFLLFYKEISKTIPNANNQKIGEISISSSTLSNRWGDKIDVERGTLVVPENRTKENSNHISIGFIRLPTSSPQPKSTIFFLSGGPGTPASDIASREYFYVFKKLSEHADVILLDQRGTGNSTPNLRCRNTLDMPTESSENWEKDILSDVVQKCRECAEEFKKLAIDLSGYNSRESAMDIEDVRKVLVKDKITLFGYSYGTTLAQHYVSMFEEQVDKLIFAGTTAPDLGVKIPADMELQYALMDSIIASDIKMSKYIPSFTHLMADQHDKLKSKPIKMKLPLMNAVGDDDGFFKVVFKVISLFKPYWNLTLSDTHLKLMMAQNVGRDGWTEIAPRYYYQLSQGEHNRLGNYLRNFRRQNMPNALFFTVAASTYYQPERWKVASQKRENALISHYDVSFGRFPEVLETFGVSVINGLNSPVRSDKELLLIAGTLDGRTPMVNADSVSSRFPNGHKITVHNGSHNDLVDGEVLEKMVEFIEGRVLKDIEIKRDFHFLPPVPYQFNMIDTIESIRKDAGVERALEKYMEIRSKYFEQEDYFYDLSEGCLNNYGYILLNDDQVDDAVQILNLNASLFPESSNVYNSLAEAYISQGDPEKVVENLTRAIELNYLDGYSHALLKKHRKVLE